MYTYALLYCLLSTINYSSSQFYRQLADKGVDTLRVPVGDWMYKPYEPFVGCWDGAVEVHTIPIALMCTFHSNTSQLFFSCICNVLYLMCVCLCVLVFMYLSGTTN